MTQIPMFPLGSVLFPHMPLLLRVFEDEDLIVHGPPRHESSTDGGDRRHRQPDHHVYEVRFRRPGENRLTIRHDGGRETYLEFFSTEPLETLIRAELRQKSSRS